MTYTVMDKMTFGRHKGKLIADLIKEDGGKGYLRWAIDNVGFFEVDDRIKYAIGYKRREPKPEPPADIPSPPVKRELSEEMKFIFS